MTKTRDLSHSESQDCVSLTRLAWLSLVESIPVNWKREIEAIDQDIGPSLCGNALPIMTVRNVCDHKLNNPLVRKG